jgi:hypothetical protein
LRATFPALRRHERSSNIVLAHALKHVSAESVLTGFQFITDEEIELSSSQHPRYPDDPLWLTVWSYSESTITPCLDIVLSCLSWSLGNYPIFLWTPHSPHSSAFAGLPPKIAGLADRLLTYVPEKRVFSVFGRTPVSKVFASYWSSRTGLDIGPEPLYSAYFSYCTAESLRVSKRPLGEGYMRKATMSDLDAVAKLCEEFSLESVSSPSPLLKLDNLTMNIRSISRWASMALEEKVSS